MKILEVSRYKPNVADGISPFVKEQGEALRAAGCEVEYFLVKGNYFKAVRPLKAKIREWKPDIVHAHFGLSAITAELQSSVPVVTTFHNGETHSPYVNLFCSLLSLRAKHVIYVARHIREKSYFNAKNYSIIPCGVTLEDCFLMDKADARKKLGWDADKKYILFGGAFDNLRKNYPLLRDAVKKIQMANAHTASADRKNWQIECIEMRGLSRAECVLRMCAADLFALPTKNEGSPQALKEAMACNCPIVATDVADIRHLLGDLPGHYILTNKCGTPADWVGDETSVDEMAELINEAFLFEGRTRGRERIMELQLTNEQVANRIIDIYKQVLSE